MSVREMKGDRRMESRGGGTEVSACSRFPTRLSIAKGVWDMALTSPFS